MLEFVSGYSRQFDNVNRDIVKGIREKDDMAASIDEACREIGRSLPDNITYLGYTPDDSGRTMRDVNKSKSKDKKDTRPSVSVDQTYARLYVFKFKLRFDGVTQIAEMPIYIPLLVDGYHYLIRGNKYSAPYQMTDAITYTNKDDMVVLKTMKRAMKVSREKCTITDVHGAQYHTHQLFLHVPKKAPFLLFYFAMFGFFSTAKYFGVEKFLSYSQEFPIDPDPSKVYFKFGTMFIGVMRSRFDENYLLRQYVATVLALGKKGLNLEIVPRVAYWKTILGSTVSDTKTLEKGQGLINTFIVSLDHRTMLNIERLIGGSPKRSMWAVMRWIFIEYSTLSSKSSSLENKRIRLSEYQITPLINAMYTKLWRYLNTSVKNRDARRLYDIFKISPALVLNAIIGKSKSRSGSLSIAKYSSYVNDLALLNVALKFTTAGPGSPMERSGKLVGSQYRRFDTSSVGRVCLITTSNTDPGISGTFVPSARLDLYTMTFREDAKNKAPRDIALTKRLIEARR